MKNTTIAGAKDLVRAALEVYRDDPAASAALQGYARRLSEPLRVAIAGMVKAGKSTLLNAIIGEEIAPTDTGECTRIVTWYRHGHTPRITLYPVEGEPRNLPLKRVDGRLVFVLGDVQAEDVQRLDVQWPAPALQAMTLIDTPGIASLSGDVSARSTSFLAPADAPSEADAIIYLMRHMHASDLRFLESFADTMAGRSGTVNALAVLSRADEVGAGRIDSLLSAGEIAERYRRDHNLRKLALGVVPVAGLLAQSARSMRQPDFDSLRLLAQLDRPVRERMLLSADRFLRATEPEGMTAKARASLLQRYGLFGIRLAVVLIRNGFDEPTPLAHELARRSGLDPLLEMLGRQFQARADALKARTALVAVDTLLRSSPREGTGDLAAALERLQVNAHEFRELRLLASLRTSGVALNPELAAEAERLIGGWGAASHVRLGLEPEATPEQLSDEVRSNLARWRALAANPLTDRAALEACRVVIRSCEGILAEASARELHRQISQRSALQEPVRHPKPLSA
ncbi:GTP-binding protein [Pseudarthrobacter phenanthrenivorans]|uniref:dynamin family protein n=1 Tax=Pseudarthrobacter phenanthrenivorans TaxID=361575 RepID=UPI00112D40DE|nr:dynamin family protein [Pseudarthrobacter phenanthrenivorans]TPV52438.1 GTP-binding protein [Pseudarthrobacter phenanthrenivorans]